MMFLMVIDAITFKPNWFRTYLPGSISQFKKTLYDKNNLSFFSLFYFNDHSDNILKWGVAQTEEFAGVVTWANYLNNPGKILLQQEFDTVSLGAIYYENYYYTCTIYA